MSRVGEKIKDERQKMGLSPKQLGKKCGVSESFILDIETGRKIISEKLLEQFSKILGKNLEGNLVMEPKAEETPEKEKISKPIEKPTKRQDLEPVGQWEEALSGIIKKVPILDVSLKVNKGYRNFPIIDRKVEGFNPDKLVYIEVPNDILKGFRILMHDLVLLYLNHEPINNSIVLIEHEGKMKLRRLKKSTGNRVELITFNQEIKADIVDLKDIKILGRGLRVEIELK